LEGSDNVKGQKCYVCSEGTNYYRT